MLQGLRLSEQSLVSDTGIFQKGANGVAVQLSHCMKFRAVLIQLEVFLRNFS